MDRAISRIKAELKRTERSISEYQEFNVREDSELIFQGWKEALEWVLTLFPKRG